MRDRQTDGWTDGVKPIYPPTTSLYNKDIIIFLEKYLRKVITSKIYCGDMAKLCDDRTARIWNTPNNFSTRLLLPVKNRYVKWLPGSNPIMWLCLPRYNTRGTNIWQAPQNSLWSCQQTTSNCRSTGRRPQICTGQTCSKHRRMAWYQWLSARLW